MDKETQKNLLKLNRFIPKEWTRKGIIKEKPLEQQKEAIKRLSDNRKVDMGLRRKFYDKLESGEYDKIRERIDDKVAEKIDTRMTEAVADQFRKGNLKPLPRCCVLSRGACQHR